MKRKPQLKVDELQEEIDLPEFVKIIQVPEIHKSIFHHIEGLKIQYRHEIAQLDKLGLLEKGENIIPLHRADYYPITVPERVKAYFEAVLANEDLLEIALAEYEEVYIPLLPGLKKAILP